MIRWLLFALILYAIYRLLFKPSRKKKAPGQFNRTGSKKGGNRYQDFDQIEEAEFEDITDKEEKKSNS